MPLDLTDDEKLALAELLRRTIADDRFPLSFRKWSHTALRLGFETTAVNLEPKARPSRSSVVSPHSCYKKRVQNGQLLTFDAYGAWRSPSVLSI
jgi:hypothetical protein